MPRAPDDPAALAGRLYDEYGASLYRYALIVLADAAAAEDAVHQVFAALMRGRLPAVDDHERYLRRAVRNECFSTLRRRAVDGDRVPRADGTTQLLEPRPEAGTAPEDRLALERAIRSLPPDQREVIHLHVYEGMTFQEVATLADESVNTIASRYRYALAKLRQALS
jgi:RNA polymerase sigma-70 factor (ECF subfamily)